MADERLRHSQPHSAAGLLKYVLALSILDSNILCVRRTGRPPLMNDKSLLALPI